MKRSLFILPLLLLALDLFSQKPEETEDWSRKPAKVTPGKNNMPPSDAIILYSGASDAGKWQEDNGNPCRWQANDSLTVAPSTGSIQTRQGFGDCQLHIEWRTPSEVKGEGQGRGNSGVFLMNKYEIQVLDSWENETYYNGMAGSVYKQYIPLVNASTPPGTWQTYDIFFTAPRFSADSTLQSAGYITVVHNGVLIQNHVELKGPTEYIGKPVYKYHNAKMPLGLQNHGNPVSYRNIWIREF
ncbi:MAG TPA: DUF1080 domain-containing protein [Bacteroidales bacterium]|nr:DUF1080 domain-containing protein [Bacteroidales bacterium]